MAFPIFLLVLSGLTWVFSGAFVGLVERRKRNLSLFQLGLAGTPVLIILVSSATGLAPILPHGASTREIVVVTASMFACGVLNFAMMNAMGAAMKRGPNAIVWAIIQSGLIYPFLLGATVFHEPMPMLRIAGIASILASILLYAFRGGTKGETQRAPQRAWFLFALLGMFLCGSNQCAAMLPSYLQLGETFNAGYRCLFSSLGMSAASITHIAISAARTPGRKDTATTTNGFAPWVLGVGVFTGLFNYASQILLAFPAMDQLSALSAGSIVYPVQVCACIVGFFPYGILVLREKILWRQALGAALGIVGIILCCR